MPRQRLLMQNIDSGEQKEYRVVYLAHRVSTRRLDCQHLEVAKRNKQIGSRIKAPALLRPTIIVRCDMWGSVTSQPNLCGNFYNGAFCETGGKPLGWSRSILR